MVGLVNFTKGFFAETKTEQYDAENFQGSKIVQFFFAENMV